MGEELQIDVFGGPIGSYGFRTGYWTFTLNGRRGRIYASIPHQCDLQEQRDILTARVHDAIARGGGQIKWTDESAAE